MHKPKRKSLNYSNFGCNDIRLIDCSIKVFSILAPFNTPKDNVELLCIGVNNFWISYFCSCSLAFHCPYVCIKTCF